MPQATAFALASFVDARQEILKRLELRERLIEVYFIGSIALFGALATLNQVQGQLQPALFLLSPLLALVISFRLRSHVDSTEGLAEFIRRDLNLALLQTESWAPYWDWSTHADKKVPRTGRYSGKKKSGRFVSEWMSLHFVCFVSMIYLFFATDQMASDPVWWGYALFGFGIGMFVVAVHNTRHSYKDREKTKEIPAISSTLWKESCKSIEKEQSECPSSSTNPPA